MSSIKHACNKGLSLRSRRKPQETNVKLAYNKVSACEAGVSIKPGAQAPGTKHRAREPMKWAAALSPASRARLIIFVCDPGACAPGFILPPASQVPGHTQWHTCFAGFEQRLSLLKLTVLLHRKLTENDREIPR